MFTVHKLVLLAFHGPAPSGKPHCRHLDGCPANNRADNLQWGTPKENEADKLLHGTRLLGEATNSVKLTAADVVEIRRIRASAKTRYWGVAALAARYGIHPVTIQGIVNHVTWQHMEDGVQYGQITT